MDDLISRQEAIDALNRLCPYPGEWSVNGLGLCKDAIANLPSIDAEPHWIPVRERLPEKYRRAILCDRYGGMMIGTMTEFGWMTPCYFAEPVAWMPVPAPYEPGREQNG